MATQKFTFFAPLARRIPDPVFFKSHSMTRHIFFVPVRKVPKGLPLDPNARVPNVNRRVYKEIEGSLLNQEAIPGTFHLKHKGITIVAEKVEQVREGQYVVTLARNQGVLDGGHTYELLTKDREEELPENQFVKFEILTNVDQDWIVDIAAGLNTSVQVQAMSLDNLAGLFGWIKELIRDEPYFKEIAWKENESGDFDARDLISLMTCFNIDLFPNKKDTQPVIGYEKKSLALKFFEEKPKTYERMKPILKEILVLHDTISCDSRDYWNEAGGKFGNLAFVEDRKRGEFTFHFTGKTSKYRLMNGALYPMLAAFRWMVEEDGKAKVLRWRGGFKEVLRRWESSAEELLRMTFQVSNELGRNPNAIGKSRSHWANLHARVAMRDLMATAEKGR